MANEKKLNARLCQKIDTTANWELATNFIPLKGEVIIYKDEGQKFNAIVSYIDADYYK